MLFVFKSPPRLRFSFVCLSLSSLSQKEKVVDRQILTNFSRVEYLTGDKQTIPFWCFDSANYPDPGIFSGNFTAIEYW